MSFLFCNSLLPLSFPRSRSRVCRQPIAMIRTSFQVAQVAAIEVLLLLSQVQCLQYITNSTLPSANLTASCANALMVNISCNSFVAGFHPGAYYSPAGLTAVCTGDCGQALHTYEEAVASACAGQMYNYTDQIYWPIAAIPSRLEYFFNRTCLQDNGRFCNYVSYQASIASNPNAQHVLGKFLAVIQDRLSGTDWSQATVPALDRRTTAMTASSRFCRLTQAHHSPVDLGWRRPSVL